MNRPVFLAALGAAVLSAHGAVTVRVVSQTVGTDEALLAVADPAQVAALSPLARDPEFSAVAAEASRFPALAPNGDAESVLKYHPNLVLCADYSRIELVSQLRTAGVRVIVFDRYASLEDAYATLRRIAHEVGAPERAAAVIAACERRRALLERRLAGVRPVRVIAPSTYGVIPGDGTTFDDLCLHAGADNLAASLGHLHGNAPPPSEELLAWPIDALVLGVSKRVERAAPDALGAALAPFQTLPPYAYLAAVKARRAVLVPSWVLGCVSYRRIDGYYALARALHPEAGR